MAKKKDKLSQSRRIQPAIPLKLRGVSKRGWKVIALGMAVVAIGFYVLSLTDPAGQNWASNLCPFLILGGYATIGIGIVLPERSEDTAKMQEEGTSLAPAEKTNVH